MIAEFFIFILSSLVAYFVFAHRKVHNYFNDIGVKYLPGVPVFGNVLRSTFAKNHFLHDLNRVYKAFPNERYVGYIEGTKPIHLIRDPELIRDITVKDFDHFVDHKEFFSEDTEPLIGGSLLMMKGKRWHDMRTTLSPAFTGSKIRHMLPFMAEISENTVEYLKDHQSEHIDIDDLVRRYTSDVIASAAFGLEVNSLKDRDNTFYKTGQSMFQFNILQRVCLFLSAQFPKLVKKLGLKMIPEKTTQFFRDLVTNTIDYREKNNIDRPDMIQLLMKASKGTQKDNTSTAQFESECFATVDETLEHQGQIQSWTDNELAGQVLLFFAAGYENSATALVMCVHEIALHPPVQEKLYQEIKSFKDRHGKLTYDNVDELKFLDCVINESPRKWASTLIMDRVCTKPYELPPPREGGKPVKLKPGDVVYNVVNPLHMDPKYFPDPETYNPERFTEENKHNIKPFTYMPFGAGPRSCIGSRFALLELKVFLYYLILNYEIQKTEKTADPIRILPDEFNIRAAGGTWVQVEARN